MSSHSSDTDDIEIDIVDYSDTDSKRTIDDVDDVENRDTPVKVPRVEPQWKIDFDNVKPENIGPLGKFGNQGVKVSYIKHKNSKGKYVKSVFTAPPGFVTLAEKHTLHPHLAGLGYSKTGDMASAKHIISLVWGHPLPDDLKKKSPRLEDEHQEFIAQVQDVTYRWFRMLFENELSREPNDYNGDIKARLAQSTTDFNSQYPHWGRNYTLLSKKELMDILTEKGYEKTQANSLINESGVLSNSEPDEFTDDKAIDTIHELTHVFNEQRKEEKIHENAFKSYMSDVYHMGYITEREGRKIMYIQFEAFSSFPDREKDPTAMEDVGNYEIQAVLDVVGPWKTRSLINFPEYRGPDGKPLIDPETKKTFNDEMKISKDMDPKFLTKEVLKVGDLVQISFGARLSDSSQGRSVKPEPYFNSIILHKRSEDAAKIVSEGSASAPDYGFGDQDPFAGTDFV